MRSLIPMVLLLGMVSLPARVIVISVDGLRSDAVTTLGAEVLPNFYRLRSEGAFTDNARTDYDFSETLPNHTCMITSRPVYGRCGHGLDVNVGFPTTNLHLEGYKAGMFDVAHDHGMATALVAGKSKFRAFEASYGDVWGGPDVTGEDNGRNKIDFFRVNVSDSSSVAGFRSGLASQRWELGMLHLRLPDSVGHGRDWSLAPESPYMASIRTIDGYLGEIFESIDTLPGFAGTTFLVVTSDHGGTPGTFTHLDAEVRTNYTVPFYVWGPGVKAGADLYDLNSDLHDPGLGRPRSDSPTPPIRNGMVGNLALQLLGLPPIPGSCFNVSQQLRLSDPPSYASLYPGLNPLEDANENGRTNFYDYATGADPLGPDRPDLLPRMSGRELLVFLRPNVDDIEPVYELTADFSRWVPLIDGIGYRRVASEEVAVSRRYRLETSSAVGRQSYFRQILSPDQL